MPGSVERCVLTEHALEGLERRGLDHAVASGRLYIHYDVTTMMSRTQISLDPAEHRRAKRRAAELGVSLSEYIRGLVRDDLGGRRVQADIRVIFDLGDSGGSDIASSKDAYIGEAVAAKLGARAAR